MTFRHHVADTFLSRLDKVRRTGDSRYTACCPAHDDNNPSMTVTIAPDRLLTYCHAMQCDHQDILAAVGMKVGDFYEDRWDAAKHAAFTQKPKLAPISLEDIDRAVLRIARADLAAGKTLSFEDEARFELAMERLRDE